MNQAAFSGFIFGTAFLLGLRHGIDWDHIAAITDITGSTEKGETAFVHATMYAFGHASVIIVFGLLAIFLGIRLPSWVDAVMEPIIGITLILLGSWLLFTLIIHGKNFRIQSRWMILLKNAAKLYNYVHNKFSRTHRKIEYPQAFTMKTAYIIGMIHGVGAETPTQILLFLAASKVGGGIMGAALLFIFVIGLLISNISLTLLSTFGYTKLQTNTSLYLTLGSVTAVFSLIVGILFLTGEATTLSSLPSFLRLTKWL